MVVFVVEPTKKHLMIMIISPKATFQRLVRPAEVPQDAMRGGVERCGFYEIGRRALRLEQARGPRGLHWEVAAFSKHTKPNL